MYCVVSKDSFFDLKKVCIGDFFKNVNKTVYLYGFYEFLLIC